MRQKQVLVIEDEPKIARLLLDYLEAEGYAAHWLDNGLKVVDWVRTHQPDLLLLDLMLPGMDGLSLCRALRTFTRVPILMVSARVEEIDRILGLEIGADDYICKPFRPREVMARVKAMFRRLEPQEAVPATGALQLDAERFLATYQGRSLELTPVEFRLLRTLISHPGRIYSRDALMEQLYEDRRIVTHRTIDSHVKNLRKKIARQQGDPEMIGSVYGLGYRFDVPS